MDLEGHDEVDPAAVGEVKPTTLPMESSMGSWLWRTSKPPLTVKGYSMVSAVLG